MLTAEERAHNFALERRLAARLREAPSSERRGLYSTVYDEFFRQAKNVGHTIDDPRVIARQVRLITRFMPRDGRYVEIGAGTCQVAAQIALAASSSVAVDVSEAVVRSDLGVRVVLSDGIDVPVEPASADLVYSNQLMEHLHPDDARDQLHGVVRALAPGGVYLCMTPNRLTGPHDISEHFTKVAEGLHLREYTIAELRKLFLAVGFRDVRVAVALGGEVLAVIPGRLYGALETVLGRLPRSVRRQRLLRKFFDPGPVLAFL